MAAADGTLTTEGQRNLISCHLITWGQDLPTAIQEASGLGFTACETFTHLAMAHADDPAAFADHLASHGLRLSALYAGARFSDAAARDETVAEIEGIARFLAALGVDRIVFGPGGPRTAPSTPDEIRAMIATIDEAATRTHALGVHACVHPHLGTELQDRNELDAVMEGTDPALVGFCPDTAHLTGAGMDPVEVIRTYGSRIGYVHLKDIAAGAASGPVESTGTDQMSLFCELGLGSVEFPAVMAALSDANYAGWLTVEIDKSQSTPLNSLTICRDYLHDTLHLDIVNAH